MPSDILLPQLGPNHPEIRGLWTVIPSTSGVSPANMAPKLPFSEMIGLP